jgi:hypothetical protein
LVVNFSLNKFDHPMMKRLEHIQVLSYVLVVMQFDFRATEISSCNGLSGQVNPRLQI